MGFGSRGGFSTTPVAPAVPPPTKTLLGVEGVAKSPAVDAPTLTLVGVAGIASSPSADTPTYTLTV